MGQTAISLAVVAAMMQCASPTGSGYNEEWTVKLKPGQVYHSIELETNLVVKTTIKKVSIDIGGTPVVSPTGKTLDLLDSLYQEHTADGRLVLNLAKFNCRSPQGIYKTSLATSVYDDITLKVEFGAKDAADPATPTMKVKAYVSDNPAANVVGGGRMFVPIQYDLTQYAAAAGKHDWVFPSGSANRFLQRLILDESECAVTRVLVKRGNTTIREMTRADLDFAAQRYSGVALQAGYLLIDFIQMGFGANDALPTHGLNFEFEVDGAGAIKTFVDGFDRVA